MEELHLKSCDLPDFTNLFRWDLAVVSDVFFAGTSSLDGEIIVRSLARVVHKDNLNQINESDSSLSNVALQALQ